MDRDSNPVTINKTRDGTVVTKKCRYIYPRLDNGPYQISENKYALLVLAVALERPNRKFKLSKFDAKRVMTKLARTGLSIAAA